MPSTKKPGLENYGADDDQDMLTPPESADEAVQRDDHKGCVDQAKLGEELAESEQSPDGDFFDASAVLETPALDGTSGATQVARDESSNLSSPWPLSKKIVVQSLVLLGFGVVAVAGYQHGSRAMQIKEGNASITSAKLVGIVRAQEVELKQLREEVIFLAQGNQVEKEAGELLRQENKQLLDAVAGLEDENAHYLRVLMPGKDSKGLSIGRLELKATSDEGRFRYRYNVIQVGGQGRVAGRSYFTVIGVQAAQKAELSLAKLVSNSANASTRLGFRNFQTVSGEILLPPEFVPEQVVVYANFKGVKNVALSKAYDWKTQESSLDPHN